MMEKSEVNRQRVASQAAYVDALQEAVDKSSTEARVEKGRLVCIPTKQFKARVAIANDRLRQELEKLGQPKVEFKLVAEQATADGDPKVRVTHPTRTRIAAKVSVRDPSNRVEFYQTRKRSDGVAETRFLGMVKYPDQTGERSLTFDTERFANRPDEPLVIHGELLDNNGFLLAAHAVGLIE